MVQHGPSGHEVILARTLLVCPHLLLIDTLR
jgi:hypothetical protein